MALPGLALPGLGLAQNTSSTPIGVASTSSSQQPPRTETLAPRTEWRFEVAFQRHYSIRLISGNAEIFGVELGPNQVYSFSGWKGAVFSWQGCELELSGEAESEYAGQETEYAVEWLNVHGMLESARDMANGTAEEGPRVLVVGPDAIGKSSFIKCLAGWSVRSGRTPTVVNVDPREGLLAPPGSFTAVTVGSQLDVGNGYGSSPISGPTMTPIKMPLVYHCPYASSSEKLDAYKALLTRTALSVANKLEEDPSAKQSGLIIDTPGQLNDPKSNYDIISHIVSEFSITLILTMGSERLFNDLNRKLGTANKVGEEEAVPVLRVAKPGGAVERDATFMKQMQSQQIRQYFFGTPKEPLNPHSHTYNFAELSVFCANSPSTASSSAFAGTGSLEDTKASSGTTSLEKVTPNNSMLGRLVAIKHCAANSNEITIRDSAVMGFAYVSEVEEVKKRVRFLAPHPHRWTDKAMVWGGWPEVVTDLVG